MNSDILNTIICAVLFLMLFCLSEILYHLFNMKAELTRKIVHIGTGLLTLLFPIMLGNHWLVLLLCSSFAIILILSIKFDLLKSINSIERKSVGSVAYPVSVYGCYLAFDYFDQDYIYFYLPILILAFCDPIAAMTGKKWPIGKYKVGTGHKTIMGSAMFFLSAFIITLILTQLSVKSADTETMILRGILISFISTLAEAVSRLGFDNITIPASVLISLIIMEQVL